MRKENTVFSNYFLIVNESNIPIAVEINGKIAFNKGDRVLVNGDIRGYICPTIIHSGVGTITNIRRDDTDKFFEVQMDSGEIGFVKALRLEKI